MRNFITIIAISTLVAFACKKKVEEAPVTNSKLANNKIVYTYKAPSSVSEIYSVSNDGTEISQISSDTTYEKWWPKISPDRAKIIYYRAPAATNEDYLQADLMIYDITTSTHTLLRARQADSWSLQAHAEWSPDGTELVTCGVVSGVVHVFVLNSSTGQIKRQLTNTGGWNCDPAWSPDGTKIIFNRCVGVNCHNTFGNLDIYIMNSNDGSNIQALTAPDSKDDYDAYYSPDGSNIAWLHQVNNSGWSGAGVWSLKKMTSSGASQSFIISDTNINSKPSWSLDGIKIYFHRMAPLEVTKYRLFSIFSDGSNLSEVQPYGLPTGASVGNITYPQN